MGLQSVKLLSTVNLDVELSPESVSQGATHELKVDDSTFHKGPFSTEACKKLGKAINALQIARGTAVLVFFPPHMGPGLITTSERTQIK